MEGLVNRRIEITNVKRIAGVFTPAVETETTVKNCPVAQIDYLIKIHELLENPDADDLRYNVGYEDFKAYVEVSIAPLDRLIGKYNSRDAKELMKWMIENPEIAKVFQREDDDYKILKKILKKIQDFTGDDQIHLPFIANLDGEKLMEVTIDGEKLMEVAIGGGKFIEMAIDGEKLMEVAIDGEKLMEVAIDGEKLMESGYRR